MLVRSLLAAVALALASTTVVRAQPAPPPASAAEAGPRAEALVRRVLKAMDFEKQIDVVVTAMLPVMQERIAKEHPEITAAQHGVLAETTLEAMRESFVPEMLEAVIPIYAATYSEAELEAMATFYESPVGRSILDKTPTLAPKVAKATQGLIPRLADEMLIRVCQKLDCEAPKTRPS
ncbi:DUF2059 domain-containing protein [Phenylobacterium sp.]|uniref:DUF2059 domain-containing protein n=1 Tax=Phenylobacterium sp. TaxID=1871053 RepID=UPI002C9D69AD|nr:DUF2059 domain-containing protein [Phenylobacterium sp.]HVI30940.1 DUF2059 domain-containing protein [Phenylobacterium sp.]